VARVFLPVDVSTLALIGVTGTDGKTTTVEMLSHMLSELNIPHLSSSSLQATLNGEVLLSSKQTTPSLWQLHTLLRKAVKSGARVAVIEVSSHALVQWRVSGLAFDVAILTNITHEHLNFHKTQENYAAAKKLLFTKHLQHGGKVILPTNDAYGSEWFTEFGDQALPYTPPIATTDKYGTAFYYNDTSYSMPMLGGYNSSNALAAALALSTLTRLKDTPTAPAALTTLQTFTGIPGRMQLLPTDESSCKATVIVDFALTARAMQSALTTARDIAQSGRVILVFGASGGQHDATVHPGLARAAAEGADSIYVTDDEPYDGDPELIRANLISYIQEAQTNCTYKDINDRREAIQNALREAREGDVVLVTGMGHYQSRTIAGKEVPWNDATVIIEELNKL
jgi:UDP-N-acetylmuramyl-tripeptide synthetase